jgi:pyruvate/2-oxoglutarate dehydrogenase complex dihydrolipoamide acyltransferase (E2) component
MSGSGPARPSGGGPVSPDPCSHRPRGPRGQVGALTLEAVLVLPVLALLVTGLLGAVGIVRDVLVLHEAARAGARAAATTGDVAPVVRAAREAAPELPDLRVTVTPAVRRDGDLARVEVRVERGVGPVTQRLRASAVARVEPAVGGSGPPTGWWPAPIGGPSP